MIEIRSGKDDIDTIYTSIIITYSFVLYANSDICDYSVGSILNNLNPSSGREPMNREITGFERMVFTKEWIKRGKPPTREAFIRKVCEVKGITYTPPPKYERRDVVVTKTARMFPVKKEEESRDE